MGPALRDGKSILALCAVVLGLADEARGVQAPAAPSIGYAAEIPILNTLDALTAVAADAQGNLWLTGITRTDRPGWSSTRPTMPT
jgi:hypothetical protein